ncbi:MAG: hypothetical protein AAF317_04090 [Pseudomonadota bacterium]
MTRAARTFPVAYPAARFRDLTGHVELHLAEAAGGDLSRPGKVTLVLAAAYSDIGGVAVTTEFARSLSSASREWLLQGAATRFHPDSDWFEAPCMTCGTRFDLEVALTQVPRSDPGPGFPIARVETSLGARDFETPNGAHEEALAVEPATGRDPRRSYAAIGGLSDLAIQEAREFTEGDLSAIDAAIEAVAPEIADRIDTICPNCGTPTATRIDPLSFAFPRTRDVLAGVHRIARTYQWSETDILDLPIRRRAAYVALIDVDSGTGSARRSAGR